MSGVDVISVSASTGGSVTCLSIVLAVEGVSSITFIPFLLSETTSPPIAFMNAVEGLAAGAFVPSERAIEVVATVVLVSTSVEIPLVSSLAAFVSFVGSSDSAFSTNSVDFSASYADFDGASSF